MQAFIGRTAAAIIAAAFVCVAGWGSWQAAQLALLRERVRDGALHADSIEAARDTTRAVLLSGQQALGVLSDSVALWQRRIVQVQQRADSLDRALGFEKRAARYLVEAGVNALQAKLQAQVSDSANGADTVRHAEFRLRQAPFTVEAEVSLPASPAQGKMTARVTLDTATFEARVGCSAANAAGIGPATLTLAGPTWVSVRLSRLEQDARVCSPAVGGGQSAAPLTRRLLSRVAMTAGYAVIVAPGGRVEGGFGVGAGIRIGW